MHSILERQLRRLEIPTNGETPPSAPAWRELLERVSLAYKDADESRYTLERSIELSSAEMTSLYSKLAAERDRLSALIGCLGDGLLVVDRHGTVQLANSEAERLLERSCAELIGRPVDEVVACPDGEAPSFGEFIRAGSCRNEDTSFVTARGTVVPVAITVNPVVHDGIAHGATIVFRDVSARRQLEASLRHAQKLESVGRLAAGIAHEINTPIQFVNDNVHFLKTSFESLGSLVERLEEIAARGNPETQSLVLAACEAADWDYLRVEIPASIEQTLGGLKRVATIVQSMKNFVHNDGGERKPADLNDALKNTLVVATHELENVAVATTDFGEIPRVVCCRDDINQVFLNLIVNAAHAIADVVEKTGGFGQIGLATRADGEYVVVSISDTGGGISEAVSRQMFDPFFTTKAVGRGSGQGLALARSLVVNKHGGELSFETKLGEGTTFHVRLPIEGAGPR